MYASAGGGGARADFNIRPFRPILPGDGASGSNPA